MHTFSVHQHELGLRRAKLFFRCHHHRMDWWYCRTKVLMLPCEQHGGLADALIAHQQRYDWLLSMVLLRRLLDQRRIVRVGNDDFGCFHAGF